MEDRLLDCRAERKSRVKVSLAVLLLVILFTLKASSVENYEFQIVGGGNYGVLKVKFDDDWYNICPDVFDSTAAELICKELGYSYLCKMRDLDVHDTEVSYEPVLSAQPNCWRSADSIADCEWKNISLPSSCFNRTRHTILTCANDSDVEVHLSGGAIPSEGIPQIRCFPDDTWYTLCGGIHWDIRDCRVLCKQLGYKTCTNWREDTNLINLGEVNLIFKDSYCGITETNILECSGDRDGTCDLEQNGVGWMSCGHEVTILGEETVLCGSGHTCTGRCGDWQREGGCQCDRYCYRFNDCCADYQSLCEAVDENEWPKTVLFPHTFDPEDYSCILTGDSDFQEEVLLIDSCNDPSVGATTIRLCEEPFNITDIFSSLPVYSDDGTTFKNVFCAICRGMRLDQITPWDVNLYYIEGSTLLSFDSIFETYVPGGQFYVPRSPADMKPRPCSNNMQSTCADSFANSTYERKCGQYYAPITFDNYFERPTFRNPDCRMCEGAIALYLEPPFEAGYCLTKNFRCHVIGDIPCREFAPLRLRPNTFVTINFEYTSLDIFARNAGVTCAEEEVYDPFLGTCRILKCPSYYQNVGSKCVPSEVPIGQQFEVRLIGSDDRSGRVEIKHLHQWYSACGEYFDANVSSVLCRQLGFDHLCTSTVGRTPRFSALNEQEPYTIGLQCTGDENSIDECETYFTFDNVTICNPIESEVIVTCGNSADVKMRLRGSTIQSEGFLQLRCNDGGEWQYVYGSEMHWDNREGQVVCKNMGYDTFAFVDRRSSMEGGVVPVVEREIYCEEFSSDLLSCPHRLVSPDDDKYAWVSCGYRENIFGESIFLCGSEHTCRGRCGSWGNGCSCDTVCVIFNDCCFDYKTHCDDSTKEDSSFTPFIDKIEYNRYRCRNYQNMELQVVSLCSPYWTNDDEIRANCETESDVKDFMLFTPVNDNDGIVYYNIFCALCNDVPRDQLTLYPILLKDTRKNHSFISINDHDNMEDLSFAGIGLPTDAPSQPRSCLTQITSCSSEAAGKCNAYYAPVFTFQDQIRNPSCLSCKENYINYCTRETCLERSNYEPCTILDGRSIIFALFDFSISDDDNSRGTCENVGEVFDPFLDICRFVGCPKGFYYASEVCEKGDLPYNSPQVVLTKPASESIECVHSLISVNINEISAVYVSSIKKNASSTGPFSVTIIAESLLASFSVKITLDNLLLSSTGRVGVFYHCGTATFLLKISGAANNVSDESCNGDELSFSHATGITNEAESFRNIFSYEFSTELNKFIRHDLSDDCWSALNPHLDCLQTAIVNPGQFDLTESRDSIIILLNNVIVGTDEFQMLRNGSILVCSYKLRLRTEIYEIAYTVCIIISLVAMLLTFITYQTFPKLRNVPGLCLMNLLAALFVANFIFLFNDDFATLPELCIGMGALSHYTWLASFAWMSVLSYNTARTFGTHSMQLNTSGNIKARLTKYSLYAWGLPFLVVAAGLFLHFCDCTEGFVFQYGGNDTCWIKDGLAVFFSVGVPVALMLTFDLVVFLYTGVSFRRSRNAVKRVRINMGTSQDVLVELAVNTRLFILLGMTWIFGFVQYLWPLMLWKVLFLVSNSLQGLFIFIMFVMKKRVLKMWLDLFSTCRVEEQAHNTKVVDDIIQKQSNGPVVISQL